MKVTLYELMLQGVDGANARLRAHCSGGTYMRSVAHDLGQLMGCGAFAGIARNSSLPGAHAGTIAGV